MKYRVAILLIIVLALCGTVSASTGNGDEIVYITDTGECYHTESCGYLWSKYKITLQEAYSRGFRRCSRCNPPVYTGSKADEWDNSREVTPSTQSELVFSRWREKEPEYESVQSDSTVGKERASEIDVSIIIILILLIGGTSIIVVIANTIKAKKLERKRKKDEAINKWKTQHKMWEQFPNKKETLVCSIGQLRNKTVKFQTLKRKLSRSSEKIKKNQSYPT